MALHASLAAVLLAGLTAPPQSIHRIPDDVSCSECDIRLTPEATFGTPHGPGAIDWRGSVSLAAFDSRGMAYLRGLYGTEIKVYGPDGSFEALIGGAGEGPGEFVAINGMFVGPRDSLYVFDVRTMRLSVFGSDHKLARTSALTVKPAGVDPKHFEWDRGHFYITSDTRTTDLIGLPIHRVTLGGRRVASFGSQTGAYSPSEPYAGLRVIADAGEGSVWSGRPAHYRVERISVESHAVMEELHRDAAFFPEPDRERLMSSGHGSEPIPFQADIMQVGDRLWVLIWAGDDNWRLAGAGLEDGHDRYDSVVEVIDLATHRVVTRARFDEQYHQFLGPGRIGGTRFEGGLVPVYHVMRMTLTGQ